MKQKSLKELIAELKLDFVTENATEENFPPEPIRGEVGIVDFKKVITSEEAIREMKEKGYVPANIYEMLSWAKDNWNGKDWIVVLGSVMRGEGGNPSVLCLSRYGSRRGLRCDWFGGGWFEDYRFAFVSASRILGNLNPRHPLNPWTL
jgi:hypothetical protein